MPTFHAPGFDPDRVARSVRRILDGTALCTIATRNATRSAPSDVHVSTAFFAWREPLELFFLSAPESEHCRNLERAPAMAAAVFDTHQRWGEPHRGLQLFGTGDQVPAEELAEAEDLYARRFARYNDFKVRGDAAFAQLRFYRFRAAWLKLLDEEEFGELKLVRAEVGGRQ